MANKSLYVHNGLAVGQSVQINGTSGDISTTGIVTSTNITNATSTVTGALQIVGGAGIGRDLYVGGTIYAAGISGSISSATNATNALNVSTVARSVLGNQFLTYVDSNNANASSEALYTTSSVFITSTGGIGAISNVQPFIFESTDSTKRLVAVYNNSTINIEGLGINRLINTNLQFYFQGNGSTKFGGDNFTFPARLTTAGISSDGTASSFAALNSSSNTLFLVRNDGNVGIGTTSPTSKLHVDGDVRLTGITTVTNTTAASSTVTGALIVNGGIGVGNNVYIAGSLFATTKSFLIDHPTKDGKKLRYGSLEGPENGVYIRGKTTDDKIELPDYWTKLVDPESITVMLTPIGRTKIPSVKKIENNVVYLNKPWFSKIDCYFVIFAERADIEKLETEI